MVSFILMQLSPCEPKRRKSRPRLEKLESIRGFAAAYVFLAHTLTVRLLQLPLIFAQEAVMLFFILSGFVIYYSTFASGRPFSLRDYSFRRVRRIYPIFLISLPWAYLNVSYGLGHWATFSWRELLGNLCMLQDWKEFKPGVWVNTFAGNAPLWSLSYEWWFYCMFVPVILFCSNRFSKYAAFAISLFGAISYPLLPNQISMFMGYFFLWWMGVEMAREFLATNKITLNGQRSSIALLSILICVWAIPCVILKLHGGRLYTLHDPLLELRHFLSVLIIEVAGITWYRLGFVGFRWTFGWFTTLAPISYALYIMHVPVVIYARYLDFISNPFLRTLAYAAILLPLCYLLEVKFQGWLNRVSDRWVRTRRELSGPAEDSPDGQLTKIIIP
jgi:peptidoglycan/LPS O-acetylase OafA/YrhL